MSSLAAARLQMTLSLAFRMIFAAIGIGLPLLMVIVEGLWLRSGSEHYKALARRWAKATGILFAVGAVSGTALSFELGLLWPRYMELTGAVVGHLFGLEGYAFFIEAIFISLYLYGWDRLGPPAHWWCAVVIAVSGMLSGVLILGVNAWVQVRVHGPRVTAVQTRARYGSVKSDLVTSGSEAAPEIASASSDRSAQGEGAGRAAIAH
jgi:cytochrome d ubiquinol oxidase subunit I